ncbi:hypothetical protein EB43_01592 [Enterococcus faecium]|nr:hypothetical protein EB43_01592 [Enterococcus faecium]
MAFLLLHNYTDFIVIYSKFYFFVKTRLFLSREKQGYDKLNTTS